MGLWVPGEPIPESLKFRRITELVQMSAQGIPYEGWESVTVTSEMGNSWATFEITTTEISPIGDSEGESAFARWHFPPGTLVTLYATGTPLVMGFVNVYAPSADADQHTITIQGTTPTKNWAESSVKHETGNFQRTTDSAIIRSFAETAGIRFEDYTSPEQISNFQVRPGATNYAESMRILQNRMKTLTARLPDGALALVGENTFFTNSGAALIQGENMLRMEARLTADSWQLTQVVGAAPYGVDLSTLQPFGIAGMPAVGDNPYPRFKKIIDQTATTMQLAQQRAMWEAMRAQGATTQATITVPGWRDQLGSFWQVNTDVYVYSSWLKIDCMMRISKVVMRQSLGTGTITQLTVTDPLAWGATGNVSGASGNCKSDIMWKAQMPLGPGSVDKVPTDDPIIHEPGPDEDHEPDGGGGGGHEDDPYGWR